MKKYLYEAVLTPNEAGGYDARFLELGLVTFGDDLLDDTMTVQEAADAPGVNRTRIYAMVKDGRLGSAKIGGARMVNARDVMDTFNARLAEAPKAGRPRKKAAA